MENAVPINWCCQSSPRMYPPPPCVSYTKVRNQYTPYAYCSLDKGVAYAQHIQLPTTQVSECMYECILTSTHVPKGMQTQEIVDNAKFQVHTHVLTSNEA